MGCELDDLMWEGWLKVRDRVMGDEVELRRRLDRRSKLFERVPRELCLALRASDLRINEDNAWLSVRRPTAKGREVEHDVHVTAGLISQLCRPVEFDWGGTFLALAEELGADQCVPRRLERRGVFGARRIPLLGGKKGLPIPLVKSPVPATAGPGSLEAYGPLVLDSCMRGRGKVEGLLGPYWASMTLRLPEWVEQTLIRRPVYRSPRGRLQFLGWRWVCPECKQEVRKVYLPMGGPDWAGLHGIKLPDWYKGPVQRMWLACGRCHGIRGHTRAERQLCGAWSELVAHMSGGLLYGKEVRRPASFVAVRKKKLVRIPRPSPRRDELERYLVETDLGYGEIARRMDVKFKSVPVMAWAICRLRGVKGGRKGLKEAGLLRSGYRATQGEAGVAAA